MSSPLKHRLEVAKTLLGTGMIAPVRPDRAVRVGRGAEAVGSHTGGGLHRLGRALPRP